MATTAADDQVDAVVIIEPLHRESWTTRTTGYHVYLQATHLNGLFGASSRPHTYTSLLDDRVFDTAVQARRFVQRYMRHNQRKYRTVAYRAIPQDSEVQP